MCQLLVFFGACPALAYAVNSADVVSAAATAVSGLALPSAAALLVNPTEHTAPGMDGDGGCDRDETAPRNRAGKRTHKNSSKHDGRKRCRTSSTAQRTLWSAPHNNFANTSAFNAHRNLANYVHSRPGLADVQIDNAYVGTNRGSGVANKGCQISKKSVGLVFFHFSISRLIFARALRTSSVFGMAWQRRQPVWPVLENLSAEGSGDTTLDGPSAGLGSSRTQLHTGATVFGAAS
jgi:hypothetical protein